MINYDQYLSHYFTSKPPKPKTSINWKSPKLADLWHEDNWLKKQKDHIMMGKEIKILETYKKISDIQVMSQSANAERTSGDNLVLTRRLNHPELIYNQ